MSNTPLSNSTLIANATEDVKDVIDRYAGKITLAEALGILETVKLELFMEAQANE